MNYMYCILSARVPCSFTRNIARKPEDHILIDRIDFARTLMTTVHNSTGIMIVI